MTDILCPIDGRVIQQVAAATRQDINRAYRAAREARDQWKRTPAGERGRILHRVGELMLRRADELGRLESENIGTPIADTVAMARRAAGSFTYFGGLADKVLGDVIPTDDRYHTYTRREPHGTVLAIVPWNAPLIFAAKKLAPALAMGNACLLKPAEESPLTSLALAGILAEAGVPEGVAQIVPGGRETGEALVADGGADLIVFTGHHETGRVIARAAADRLIPTAMELGGKSPQIVFPDADLDRVVEGVLSGIFGDCGQACIAGSRLLAHDDVYDVLLERLAARTRGLVVGDPRVPGVHVGPQATARQRDKTLSMIARTVDEGAAVIAQAAVPADGGLAGGFYVPPTIFGDVRPEMEVMREEVFGPVLAVGRFGSEEEAVRIANDTRFGLSAGVWTSNLARAHRVANALDAGTVWLNTYKVISDLVPFGGIGLSGYGRQGGRSAIELYTRVKSVWTSLSDGVTDEILL